MGDYFYTFVYAVMSYYVYFNDWRQGWKLASTDRFRLHFGSFYLKRLPILGLLIRRLKWRS
jgi:hypothetical protein